jgi:glutathione S-transferase
MEVKLYGLSVSHPVNAVRGMLEHKGIDYKLINMPIGTQPILLRAAGFRRRTVPALKIDGRRVQGSTTISRALEELRPNPPLFPAERRAAVEEAEAWGEREFQPLPRRFFRWGLAHLPDLRVWIAKQVLHAPAPDLVAASLTPMARYFAGLSRADDDHIRAGLALLPSALNHVDRLIAEGTIGREGEPTAADFQIASTIAALRAFSDIRPALEGRPGTKLAAQLFPSAGQKLPPFLPRDWLAPLTRSTA